ncbi:MAG TPA: hypothetical protein VGE35_04015 [Candidatus Paceibacterota bacterium]
MNATVTLESLDKKVEGYRESTVNRFNSIEEKMAEESLFVRAGFDRMDRGFEEMRAGFDRMDKRFERIDAGFEQMDKRFEKMEERMDRMDDRQDTFEAKLDDFTLMIQRVFMAKGQNPFAEGDILE